MSAGIWDAGDAEHIASWPPRLALAVANWLEAELDCHKETIALMASKPAPEGYRWTIGASTLGPALAVATAYLNGE